MTTTLRKARKNRGLTLLDVARAVGTDTGNLSRIERGSQVPSGDLAARLYDYYGGEVDWPEILNIHRPSSDSSPSTRKDAPHESAA